MSFERKAKARTRHTPGEASPARACRVCGCSDSDCRACIEKTGEPCYWVAPDLCSACAPALERVR
jgi:hypothetical protein